MSEINSLLGSTSTSSSHGTSGSKKKKKAPHFGSSASMGGDSYTGSGEAGVKGLAKIAAAVAGIVVAVRNRKKLKEVIGKLIKNPKEALASLKKTAEKAAEKAKDEVADAAGKAGKRTKAGAKSAGKTAGQEAAGAANGAVNS